jgi:hypothetical protein
MEIKVKTRLWLLSIIVIIATGVWVFRERLQEVIKAKYDSED